MVDPARRNTPSRTQIAAARALAAQSSEIALAGQRILDTYRAQVEQVSRVVLAAYATQQRSASIVFAASEAAEHNRRMLANIVESNNIRAALAATAITFEDTLRPSITALRSFTAANWDFASTASSITQLLDGIDLQTLIVDDLDLSESAEAELQEFEDEVSLDDSEPVVLSERVRIWWADLPALERAVAVLALLTAWSAVYGIVRGENPTDELLATVRDVVLFLLLGQLKKGD